MAMASGWMMATFGGGRYDIFGRMERSINPLARLNRVNGT